MQVTLPYPPSANRYYRVVMGRAVKSAEAREYLIVASAEATRQGLRPIESGDVVLTIDLYRPQKSGDVDNRIKQLADALQGIAYANDKQIKKITVERHDTDRKNPRAVVTIESAKL